MRAVIPVAGFGTRLRPHTLTHAKVLLNVGDKPIIAHILDKLLQENILKVTFIVGFKGDEIEKYISDSYPQLEADYIEQKELLGLGHAIYTAVPTFNDEEIFIILGDTVFDVDLKQVFNLTTSSLGVKEVDDPRRFGVAELKDGFVTNLIEKPQNPITKLALVGLYYIKNAKLLGECLEELINKNIKTKNEYQLTDALQLMIDKGEKFSTFNVDGWYDCGKPETLLSTNRFILSQNGNQPEVEGVVINPPVYVAPSAKITNSVIGPYATICEDCEITDSTIQNSIIYEKSIIKNIKLTDSIIGTEANVIGNGNSQKLNIGDTSEIEFIND